MKILALLLLASLNAQAKPPIYKRKVPSSFCTPLSSLSRVVDSCEKNVELTKAINDCWDKLNDLEKKITKDLKSQVGTPAPGAQDESFGVSGATYEEGRAAHAYLWEVTDLAYKEVDSYFDLLVYPEDEDSDEEIKSTPCYIDPAKKMDSLADDFERKRQDVGDRIEAADAMHATVQSSKGGESSVNSSAAGGNTAAGAVTTKKKKAAGSTITGTEESKKKQSQ